MHKNVNFRIRAVFEFQVYYLIVGTWINFDILSLSLLISQMVIVTLLSYCKDRLA